MKREGTDVIERGGELFTGKTMMIFVAEKGESASRSLRSRVDEGVLRT